ncbi:hypothetical protein CDAR_419941 [Caerostris darwini]|uniref:Uncharacterized protein n=1 Tax=Caerostris darwini TaxID=1538125 RepID=A0AAV4SNK4_9ARAC|nr:hypothetical protein CDAR_419941 [Caerostris darwini]
MWVLVSVGPLVTIGSSTRNPKKKELNLQDDLNQDKKIRTTSYGKSHPWYNRQIPGGAPTIKAHRVVQTTYSKLASGRILRLSFDKTKKQLSESVPTVTQSRPLPNTC